LFCFGHHETAGKRGVFKLSLWFGEKTVACSGGVIAHSVLGFAQNDLKNNDFARSSVILTGCCGSFSHFMGIMNTLHGSTAHVPVL
jgi:hypothetical protein